MSHTPDLLEQEDRWANKFARFVIRYRKPYMWIVLIATLLMAAYLPKLNILNDPDSLLPPSNRYVATNAYGEQKFGMGNLMVFGIRIKDGGDIYQPWFINLVQEIHNKLVALPTARSSNFMDIAAQKIKYMGADESGLVFKRLIPTDGIDTNDPARAKEQLAFLKEGLEGNPVLAPMLVYMEDPQGKRCEFGEFEQKNCTAKATFIIGDYTDEVKPIYLSWIKEVRALMDEVKKDPRVEIYVAGEPYFLAYMLLDLVNHWWLFALSVLIVLVVLWLEFRNWRGALFPLAGVFATIIMTLGLMGFTEYELTTMVVLTPMLLLAIGIGHSVQVTRRFLLEHAGHGDCTRSAEIAIAHLIVPATISAIAEMIGFATLGTVDISFYKDYAYFGMFGMLTLLFTTTTLIPLLLMTFPPSRHDCEVRESHSWEIGMGGFLTRVVQGPGKWVPVTAVVLMIAVSAHYSGLLRGTWEDPMPGIEKGINYSRAAFKEQAPTIQDINKLGEMMPGVISVNIPLRGKTPIKPECDIDGKPEGCHNTEKDGPQGIFNDADVMADIERFEDWMRAHPYIGFTGSYVQYVKMVNMLLTAEPGTKPDMKHFHIPDAAYLKAIDPNDDRDPNEMVRLYNGLLEIMTSSGDMDSFISRDWNEGVIMGFVNTMDPVATHKVTADIQDYIEQHKNDAGFKKLNFGLRCGDASCDTGPLATEGPTYVRPGLGGFLGATEATREVALDHWLSGPLTTALAVFLACAIIFRSLSVAAILIGLMLITLFAQYGLGGYFTSVKDWSGNLAFHLLVTLSIAMGLGIDYGIYIFSRLREEMKATGNDWWQSLRNTQNTTGSAVIVSVVVLLGSFLPLVGTDLANTWGLAIYLGEALVIDVVTALTLLPMIVWWVKPKYVFGDK